MAFGLRTDVLRPTDSERADRVSFVELFFDLVFVFALTQLGSYLYEHQTPLGALEGAILVGALWWAWVSTTWLTNWLDPMRLAVRGAVLALAVVAMLMSVSVAEAFGDRAWTFALAYVALALGRTLFMVWAIARHDDALAGDYRKVLVWTSAACCFWIVGALLPLPAQLPLWCIALAIEITGSALGYPLPGRGRVEIDGWDVSGAHIAERTSLFVLIALGEGLLVTGFAFVDVESSLDAVIALCAAFIAAAACWWIYFDHGQRAAAEEIEAADSPGRVVRRAYSWIHLLIVAGIVMLAVGDKEVLAHPHEQSLPAVITVLGGPVLFLVGTLAFRRIVEGRWVRAQIAGLAALALVAIATPWLDPLATGVLATAVLVATAAGETIERMRRRLPKGG